MKRRYQFPKKTVRDVPIHGKRILLRADFNVPLGRDGQVEGDYRITQTLPTLRYLLERGCPVVVISHLGRPEGKPGKKYSLAPVARALAAALAEYSVQFVGSTIDDAARQACKKLAPGSLVLLENLRFSPGEEANDPDFAHALKQVSGADYFVQDGFGVVHRAHASTEAITHLLPSAAGLLLEEEVTTLEGAMEDPTHPLVAVIGGAKISDKIEFIERLLKIADTLLIGGAMANTFLQYQGYEVGKSLVEAGQEEKIATILQKAHEGQLVLPTDVVVSKEIATKSQKHTCGLDEVNPEELILDLGEKTTQRFTAAIAGASTVLWNGTLGMAEIPQFAVSSAAIAQAMASDPRLTSIIGGGDTADFVLDWQKTHLDGQFSHISTGGGASLELMSGQDLPGVRALLDK